MLAFIVVIIWFECMCVDVHVLKMEFFVLWSLAIWTS
jgi:hypothetical protein